MTGACEVMAADIDPVSLAAMALNAEANRVAFSTSADDLLAADPQPFDVVIIGDLFYERALADQVLAFIDKAVAGGAVILIGDPQRSYFPRGRFAKVTEYQVPVTRELEDSEIKRTSVWQAP